MVYGLFFLVPDVIPREQISGLTEIATHREERPGSFTLKKKVSYY